MASDRRQPVLTKADAWRRWIAGEWGNTIPSWYSLDEFYEEPNPPPCVALRYRGQVAGSPFCLYDVPREDVPATVQRITRELGIDPKRIAVNSSTNCDDALLVQGEARRDPGGLYLFYTRAQKKMRLAFREHAAHARGAAALAIVDWAMDPPSREMFDYILDHYPDHVVEFSCWSIPWGTLCWNTIFWEVRRY